MTSRTFETLKIEGEIKVDSEFGKQIGFTSDKFSGWCWIIGKKFYISFIESRHQGRGNLRALIKNAQDLGYQVCVPTPFARMHHILDRLGFVSVTEETDMGPCEVMVSPQL